MLGNSASFSNNHVEIIDKLLTLELGNVKVIIPLSYGDKKYGKYIADYAKWNLGKNAFPMLDFVPYDQYAELLASCGVVIMNHIRQQALGNVMQALMNGSRIYLNEQSTLYEFLVASGFHLSTIQKLSQIYPLTPLEQQHNKELYNRVFGKEAQQKKAKQLILKCMQIHS